MVRKIVVAIVGSIIASIAIAGAWGTGIFDNDDAQDFVERFMQDPKHGYEFMAMSMLDMAYNDGYIEAPDASFSLAAVEVVAAVNGNPSDALPEAIAVWAKGRDKPDSLTLERARGVLDRVLNIDNSELAQLFADDPGLDKEWRMALADLYERLE